jgi:hypothetical protein
MAIYPGEGEWVVVLEERSCAETKRRVAEWREEFDPTHQIPDDEIMIETYRVWTQPDESESLSDPVVSRWWTAGK